MALIVQKYGGTSVGTPERIEAVADRVIRWKQQGNDVIVVVSAMSGETNKLVALINAINPQGSEREKDAILSTGEQVTIGLLAMALEKKGQPARSYTGAQVRILTDDAHTKARIRDIDADPIRKDLAEGKVVVVAGFQGVTEDGSITTLGRGGSDTTGVALAVALKADECQIYTDVDGVYTTDPRVEPKARHIPRLTLEEMLEMASQGSKVLQIRSVEFAYKYDMPIRVLSSFDEFGQGKSTLVTREEEVMEEVSVRGIAFNRDEAQLTVLGVPDRPGVAYQILGPISEANVEVDMIVQNIGSDGSTDFTFTVHKNDYAKARQILCKTAETMGAKQCTGDEHIAKVAIVGAGMRSHAGVASKMFKTLADEGINIRMISTSEIKVAVVVDEKYLELAVRVLHDAFGLSQAA
ncbi:MULTISPECIES: aspartate kinase [Thiothrix]|jgi:aspartate kinase, monofunctional class|uniref:Aspartokinase n=2 Tax=Thiothrix TaxID=1030 RepID=A0A975F784_9GAMM|nr:MULTISPECIES: aspartate kinase [Thiothrix]MDX9988709.1 aspartate kinase [Thiothrix unzii]OQX03411.1 MAG: aspartate kinase [Thiothrix lacustris]QTR52224.1 aspartate kinase [Thiothrix unzii]